MNNQIKTITFFLINILNASAAFLVSKYLTSVLTVNQYSIYAYVISVATLLSAAYTGIPTIVINHLLSRSNIDNKIPRVDIVRKISTIIYFSALPLFLFGLFYVYLINRSLFHDYYGLLFVALLSAPLKGFLLLLDGTFRANYRNLLASFSFNWGKSAFNIILLLLVMPYVPSPHLLVAAVVVFTLSFALTLATSSLKYLSMHLTTLSIKLPCITLPTISIPILKEFLLLSLTLSLPIINGNIDLQMLALYGHVEEIGFYNLAKVIAALTTLAMLSTSNLYSPYLKKALSINNMLAVQQIIKNTCRFSFVTCLLVSLMLIAYGQYGINLIYGSAYNYTYTVLIFLLPGFLVNSFTGSSPSLFLMTSRSNTVFKIALFSIIINLIGNVVLVPLLGAKGAAASTSIAQLSSNSAYCYLTYSKFKFLPVPW